MSVPKRFKTKVQLATKQFGRVELIKGNPAISIYKNILFVHAAKRKNVCNHRVSFFIKN